MNHIAEAENYRFPSRKPWLILLALILAGWVGWELWARRSTKPEVQPEKLPQASQGAVIPVATPAAQKPAAHALPVQDPKKAAPAAAPADDWDAEYQKATAVEAAGNAIEARRAYERLLASANDPARKADIESRLGKINMALIFSPTPMPEKVEYTIKSGDSMERIAKKHGVTTELLALGNNIKNANVIRPGDLLRILTGKFSIHVEKKTNTLILMHNNKFIKRYLVGTGKFGKTPVGTFAVTDRIPEPPWTHEGRIIPYGDKDNLLGTRWMAIKATGNTPEAHGYGIHGTWDDASIGKAESLGCIRMHNADVEELFNLITVGAVVTISE
jgi:lipoprotein-anchoring transpeptidase ErfK/SrfK